MRRGYKLYLKDILEAIARIGEFVEELSLDRKENLADKVGQLSNNRRQTTSQPQNTSAEGDITIKLELRTYFRRQANESY